MRVDGLGRAIAGGAGVGRFAAAGVAFRLPDEAPQKGSARSAAPLRSAPALDALLALQAVEVRPVDPRRRRAARRGRGLLDALESLKADMLHGRDGLASLEALRLQLAEAGEATGDAALDDLLAAIDLRAQVELAKRRQADPRRP